LINRILIIGLGSIGKRHLRLAREMLPHSEIGVLRHQKSDQLPEFANYLFNTVTEALAFSPEIAVIANPATFHISVALPFAKAGVHLLIEKPLSSNINSIKSLIEICRKQKIVLAVGYNLRFLPSLQKFKNLITDGVIGEVWSVRTETGQYLPTWRPDTDYRNAVSAQSALGGGVILELSHELDYLCWIFGEVEWVQAVSSQQSDLDLDVEDTMHLIMGFSTSTNQKALIGTLNLDFIRRDTTRLCTVIGETGCLRWNGISGTIENYNVTKQGWIEIYRDKGARDETYIEEWKDFLAAVRNENSPVVSGIDGLKTLCVIEAIRQSAETGNRVKNCHALEPHSGYQL